MKNLLSYFTNATPINAYSEMTIGQSHLSNLFIAAIAVVLLTTIIKNIKLAK